MPTFSSTAQGSSSKSFHMHKRDRRANRRLLLSLHSNWKWPDVEDLHAFQGTLVHTARWPKNFDPAGKTVAVIGNGATGIQLLPEIQPSTCHMPLLILVAVGLSSQVN